MENTIRINPAFHTSNYITLNDQSASVTIRCNTNTEPNDINTIMEGPF